MLETHQKGIHDALAGMEGEAERLYREERPLLDDDSRCACACFGWRRPVPGDSHLLSCCRFVLKYE